MGDIINPFGKQITKVETEWLGRTLSIEINRVGFRTNSSVIVRYGNTVVLGTAMVSDKAPKGFNYFPMSIDYEERFYAAGKISGSRFVKREGRPSEDAILIGRLIDRPIRPLFPKGYQNEVQGVATVLSMDKNFRPDMIAMLAISAALSLTAAPFDGPIAGLRVGYVDGKLNAFLSGEQAEASDLDLVVAGKKENIMMVEAGANEVSEAQVIEALAYAQEQLQPAIALQQELIDLVKPATQEFVSALPSDELKKEVDSFLDGKLGENIRTDYPTRIEKIAAIKDEMLAHFEEKLGDDFSGVEGDYKDAFENAINQDVRDGIIKDQARPDNRKITEVRELSSQVGFLPQAHGSSIFTRGITQAMNITTLAPMSFAQLLDTMEHDDYTKRYMHHYNAPGYTVGEIRRLGGAGRREIGHSALAERALMPVLPTEEEFPYAIRSVTEIMSQHGSTSMAATCSSTLSLMDAGVPIKRPVSGIAMGLMLDGDKEYILSDIADAEDFAGDMDFKVTGTEKGITSLQMDMKLHGLPVELLAKTIEQAKPGRAHILEHMMTILKAPRDDLSEFAPRIESIKINPDKIREIIGKGGETINRIIDETGAEIDIKDDGTVFIASPDKRSIEAAKRMIEEIVAEPEIGKIYENAPVVSVLDFGAFVQIMPGKDGLVHISELSEDRVEKVTDVVKEGDNVTVKLIAIDDRGRLQLSMKAAAKESK